MLGYAVDAYLPEMRQHAESLMVDACVITKAGEGSGVFNQDTGQYDEPDWVTVYTGRCRVQISADIVNATDSESAERQWTVQAAVVQLPVVGSEAVRVDQVVEITAAVHDQALVGRKYGVTALHHKTHATSRRLRVMETTG